MSDTGGLAARSRALLSPPPHQGDQFVVNDLDHLLARGQALQDLGSDSTLPDLFYEILDDLEVDVGLKQGKPHFAERLLDVLLGHDTLTAELLENLFQLVGKTIEHQTHNGDGTNRLQRPRRRRSSPVKG